MGEDKTQVKFSPRTWGCTLQGNLKPSSATVFPTHVGVYLAEKLEKDLFEGFPHARGGVPYMFHPFEKPSPFSPRTWGCTVKGVGSGPIAQVFPTHVGVYLDAWRERILPM